MRDIGGGYSGLELEWGSYEPYRPGLVGLLEEMPRREARMEYNRLMAAKPARIAMLRELLHVNGFSFGTDETGLQSLNDWFQMYVEPDPSDPVLLRPIWYSVANDVGLFLGDVMIERAPGLRWELCTGGKRDVSYHRNVVAGFTNVPYKPYHENTSQLTAVYGLRIIARDPVPRHAVPRDFFVWTVARACQNA